MSRRGFLYGSAMVAGSVMLSACNSKNGTSDSSSSTPSGNSAKGSAKKPLAPPKSFHESPLLASQAKSGKLPAVAKRLPEHPYVIPHNWVQRGKYGGKLNMVVFSSQGAAAADSNREFFYGFSPLRYINDGQDIGPGLVETWTSNPDASEWTLNFRKGLKWSDGQPFSVDDVLFWWNDLVLPGHYAQVPPDECRSAKGTLCKFSRVDETTLKLTYDAPAPLLADHLAAWVKGGIGHNGTTWVLPKHYLKAFHPKYNPKVPKGWDTIGGLWETHADWIRNPDCPTLLGFRTKTFDNNKGILLERNPYYWAVTKDGDQLPYLDEINISVVQNAQVIALQVQQGKVDYCHGPFNQIDLSDVSTLKQTTQKADTRILLWDSGSGTGSIFFLNYDHPDPKLRKLFREPKFRQAISHAFDRDTIQKALYFQTGEQTTGTMSPKAVEYLINDQGKQIYKQWRDSYKKHDPAKAKALLAELGLKDNDGDGYVEMADGTKLTVRLDYSADIDSTSAAKDDQLVRDCKAVGLHMVRNPISPQSYGTQWSNGQLMVHTNWEASDGPNCLVNPTWQVPIESARWAPLEGEYYAVRGTAAEHTEKNVDPWKRNPPRLEPDPAGPVQKLWDLYDQTKREPDQMKRIQLVWEITKIHISDGPFFMGCVANFPQVVVVKNDLKNVPAQENLALNGYVNTWAVPCPAMYDPECYFWDNPDQHTT
ncbi:MAG TPA: ABC transporter substrate-binding protein [Mycobacteriales bacterium]|jgi:peptide/nickel transport system substrate-binding protein|nr:ABC transporter substrate-binding protein [Mycobacteriales bacterium]